MSPRMIASNFTPDERAFEQNTVAHLKAFSKVIDVTRFITVNHWEIDKILDLYEEVLGNNPDIFFVSKRKISIRFTRKRDGSIRYARLCNIVYVFPQEEYQQNKIRFDAEVKKAIAYVGKETAPEKIAQRLHDYIVWTCEYDNAALKDKNRSLQARSVYSVLVRHQAVCEGYTMAYRYLLEKFGIPCEEIVSKDLKHCWNYVKIGNHWYHVDVTFDDPVFVDENGRRIIQSAGPTIDPRKISHKFFLCSDAALCDHQSWTTKGLPRATDRTFDNRVWS